MWMSTRIRKTIGAVALAAALAAGAGEARAQGTIDAQAQGAVLVLPYLTTSPQGGERITISTVTNLFLEFAITLHLVWISGDPGDGWASLDYNCPLTPLETTYFVFEKAEDGTATVTFECSTLGQATPDPSETNHVYTRSIPGQNGIMFVAVECQIGSPACPPGPLGKRTLPDNALLGDASVVDFAQGYAFSVGAIHIQGLSSNDGDRLYAFDGLTDYETFASALTTNYIAPDDDTTLELILFTLDGKVNAGPGIVAQVVGFAFDDDENFSSGAIEFDCFVVQDVSAPPPHGFGTNIRRDVGGHLVGHLELYPTHTAAFDVHENNPVTGDGNGSRRRPVHGWLVQTTARLGDVAGTGNRSSSPAAWARTLVQGLNPLTPVGTDLPSLFAGPPPL